MRSFKRTRAQLLDTHEKGLLVLAIQPLNLGAEFISFARAGLREECDYPMPEKPFPVALFLPFGEHLRPIGRGGLFPLAELRSESAIQIYIVARSY